MTDASLPQPPIYQALQYLRREAIDAHLAGDGIRIFHQCTTALERVVENGKGDKNRTIDLQKVRWAFFLGMYWLLDDWFLYLVEKALGNLLSDDDAQHDRTMIEFLLTTLKIPLNFESSEKLTSLPSEFLEVRSKEIEDLAALSLAIEICWYENPAGSQWRQTIDDWRSRISKNTPLNLELDRLSKRLGVQKKLYSGDSLLSGDPTDLGSTQEQDWLLRGWTLYFDREFDELDKLLNEVSPHIRTESPFYSQFFQLFHWSRMYRKGADSQFLFMSRRNLVVSCQPADVLRELRNDRFASAYSNLARRGFPVGAANERFKCFRMAMLNQMHALRDWDIGRWRIGEKQRAYACLELGARGDVEFARRGVLHLVRSNNVEKTGKYPHFDQCVRLLDTLSEDRRRALVEEFLASPRNNWLSVNRVLAELSDAIPPDILPRVAEWSARLELDKYHSRHAVTNLEFWCDILRWAPNSREVSACLYPALKEQAIRPACWQLLHDTFIAAIIADPDDSGRDWCHKSFNPNRLTATGISTSFRFCTTWLASARVCANNALCGSVNM